MTKREAQRAAWQWANAHTPGARVLKRRRTENGSGRMFDVLSGPTEKCFLLVRLIVFDTGDLVVAKDRRSKFVRAD